MHSIGLQEQASTKIYWVLDAVVIFFSLTGLPLFTYIYIPRLAMPELLKPESALLRPPLKKMLFLVSRPGEYITADWKLFSIFVFFVSKNVSTFLTKKG